MALNLLVGGGRGGGGVRSTRVINQNVCERFFNSRVAGQHLLVLGTVVEPAFGVQRLIIHGIPVYGGNTLLLVPA